MTNSFSEKIRLLRHKMDLNQYEFSALIGIKQPTLSTYERGVSSPSLEVLISIAEKCNVSLDWLCGLENKTCFYTGSDFVNMFLKIKELPGFNYDIDVSWENVDIENQRYITKLTFTGESEPQLQLMPKDFFDANTFAKFMQEYSELENRLKSLGDNELTEDYKKMWLEKKLQEYSAYQIKEQENLHAGKKT